ncbi:MFS transporter [Amycolatopsis thermoflava]|uniref:MFS transporter n=1 Tax=Amycolatopsis thermoflava TaxID=84480 RepID=UPI003D720AC0
MSGPAGATPSADPTSEEELLARMERIPFRRGFHGRVVAMLGAGTFFDNFDLISLSIVLSAVAVNLHLDSAAAGLLISVGFLGQAIGAIGFGLLSERFGRKRVFVAALALLGLMSVASAFAPSSELLGLMRFLQGVGLGAEVPVATALLNEFVRGRSRGRVLMLYKLTLPLGVLAASAVGAVLLATLPPTSSWRAMFLFGGIPLILAFIAYRTLPESPRYLVQQGHLEEARRIVNAMEGTTTPEQGPALTVKQRPQPTRFSEIFSTRYRSRTLVAWALWFSTYFVLTGMLTWLPVLLVQIGHLTPSIASTVVGALALLDIVILIVIASTVDSAGRRFWFRCGYGTALLGAALGVAFGMAGVLQTWWAILAASTVLLVGVKINGPLVYLYSAEIYPTRIRAWGTMSASSWRNIAAAFAPSLVGFLLQGGTGLPVVYVVFGLIAVAGFCVQARWVDETKQAALEELAR